MSTVNAAATGRPITAPTTPRYRRWLERFFGEHIWDRVVLIEFYPWEVDDQRRSQLVTMGRDRTFAWSQGLPEVRQHEKSKHEEKTALLRRRLLEPQEVKAPVDRESLRFGDDDMALLARLPYLETLNLGYTYITDASLSQLTSLRKLTELRLQGTDVGDEGMEHIGKLTQLRVLHLHYTQVTDAGLKHVRNLKNLEKLFIFGTQIGDTGVRHLSSLKRLQVLFLNETQVTDEGMAYLESMPALEQVNLHGTRVTGNCIRSLGKALPNCTISR